MFKLLPPEPHKAIGKKAISENNIPYIALHHQISRNTVYARQWRAQSALNDEFFASTSDENVLFYIPVTKVFLHQMVIALQMICKCSTNPI